MKLYHGSKREDLDEINIKKNQAQSCEDVVVPKDETLEAIYLTPDYAYALIMAAKPNGSTRIDTDNKTVAFENPNLFDSQRKIYVYEVDVAEEEARKIDGLQYVVENIDEIKPVHKFIHKAGDIEKYYKIEKWKKENEIEFKIK